MSSPRLTLRLDLDLVSDPIEGELWEPTGLSLAFSGWLGLADAVERAIDHHHHLIHTESSKEDSDVI